MKIITFLGFESLYLSNESIQRKHKHGDVNMHV
jgi:hypothetical protein